MPENANQQSYVVHKEHLRTPYLQVNKDLWKEVHKELKTGGAFSLWLWYSSNADGYADDIYPTTIQKELGLGKQTYYNARDKLIDYGYLIVDRFKKYEYHFYERSPVRNSWKLKIKKEANKETELQNEYKNLIKKGKDPIEMSLEEWWLYNRGKKNHWPENWNF